MLARSMLVRAFAGVCNVSNTPLLQLQQGHHGPQFYLHSCIHIEHWPDPVGLHIMGLQPLRGTPTSSNVLLALSLRLWSCGPCERSQAPLTLVCSTSTQPEPTAASGPIIVAPCIEICFRFLPFSRVLPGRACLSVAVKCRKCERSKVLIGMGTTASARTLVSHKKLVRDFTGVTAVSSGPVRGNTSSLICRCVQVHAVASARR